MDICFIIQGLSFNNPNPNPNPNPNQGRIENIECRYMGQGYRLGRYPIHFHMIGTVRNS